MAEVEVVDGAASAGLRLLTSSPAIIKHVLARDEGAMLCALQPAPQSCEHSLHVAA